MHFPILSCLQVFICYSFIHCRHLYSTSSSGTTQKHSQPQRSRIMLFLVAEGISGRILLEVTGEPMGDHSIQKGQPRKRPGSAWWRFEQMGHEGGPDQPNEGGERRWRVLRAVREGQQRSAR